LLPSLLQRRWRFRGVLDLHFGSDRSSDCAARLCQCYITFASQTASSPTPPITSSTADCSSSPQISHCTPAPLTISRPDTTWRTKRTYQALSSSVFTGIAYRRGNCERAGLHGREIRNMSRAMLLRMLDVIYICLSHPRITVTCIALCEGVFA
jgi:hypothetical protein